MESEIEALRKGSDTALAVAKGKLDSMLKEKDSIESHFHGCVAANKGFEKSNSAPREELESINISHSEQVAFQQSQFGTELEGLRLEYQRILEQREADEEARSRGRREGETSAGRKCASAEG